MGGLRRWDVTPTKAAMGNAPTAMACATPPDARGEDAAFAYDERARAQKGGEVAGTRGRGGAQRRMGGDGD